MSKKLIAQIATAVIVDGERVVIQPGQPLPEVSAHDENQLVLGGAAADAAADAKQDKADEKAAAASAAAFEKARAAVQAEQASIKPPEATKAADKK